MRDTVCAVATAAGPGAVGIVRISGPQALELLRRVCRMRRVRPRRLHAARLYHPHSLELLDRALVCYMPGPRSYTGEDVVEVHGHGGELNIRRILSVFIELGARQAAPGEFTRRAFLNGRMDLTQAEAVARIIAVRSERALRNSQAILSGALGQRLAQLRGRVVELTGLLEAAIDFADDTGEPGMQELQRRHRELVQDLKTLAGTYEQGARLDGVRIALVGPVNAGKSSLFNRLLGEERALVAREPGTTRDYLEAETSWNGQRVTLLDTAGQRPAQELSSLERAGQALAARALHRCDLQLVVLALDQDLPRLEPPGPTVLVCANKVDLLATDERQRRIRPLVEAGFSPVLTSALTGEGLEELQRRVVDQLFADGDEGETVHVVEQRHWEGLLRSAEAVAHGARALERGLPPEVVVEHCREALASLDGLTGKRSTEDVLDSVFQRFCVGK